MIIGYAFHGPKTPKLSDQIKVLEAEGCEKIFEDAAPDREWRHHMINSAGVRAGDTLVIAKPSIIGSGAKDTFDTVKAISDLKVMIKVVGCGAKLYTEEKEMRDFAAVALKIARQVNAERLNQTRVSAGRKSKWQLTPEMEGLLRIFWHDGKTPMASIVEAACFLSGTKITRENLAQRLGPRGHDPREKT
ncbi:hypothetical protein [uncultured Roseobacter sp.]|uniref:hypothetical protein n=1 Tax=uncultured Roseobacter sp. TaxID=114847 RepID=UPI00262FFB04|nr:hypothetical protein [uncultured Roseobacter sp.]